ncbi:MAG: Thermophilic serine proteinase precursor [Deltaproteobacteria bacterium ADurb.Bin510]|nr:MAG: Thermophilic serine proteinase precursor [Deltaproteobacteria bacterium ADurb.Bin510]
MKKLNALLGISLSLLLTGNAIAQDFKSGEVIVKFKSNSVFANAVGASGQNQPQVVAVEDTASAIAELSQRSDVEYVEPNYIVTAEAEVKPTDDWTYTGAAWADVDLPEAYALTSPAATSVIVAVVDSGCDLDHPDLVGRLVNGKSFVDGFSEADDDAGHGTRVAGIIAAQGNNDGVNTNVAGVAWDANVKVMPLKFMKKNGTSTTGYISDAIEAIYYAVDHGASVINASWGFSSYSSALEDAVRYAQSHGVLFVASAGNNGTDNDVTPHYPSNFTLDNVIAVAALNTSGDIASFSNYGYYSVDVAAPGQGLASTAEDGTIDTWNSGTSFAAPVVSGIAALLINHNNNLDYAAVRTRIITNSVVKSSYSQTLKDCNGVVNAYYALTNGNAHAVHDKSEWSSTSAQNSGDSSAAAAGGGGGGGGACFVASAETNGLAGLAIALTLLVGMTMIPRRRND